MILDQTHYVVQYSMCHCRSQIRFTLLRALNDRLVTSFRLGKYASMVGAVSLKLHDLELDVMVSLVLR